MSQHVTCHVHMFVSVWPVDVVGVMSALVRGLELTERRARALPPCPLPRQQLTPQLLSPLLSQLPSASPAYIHC